MPTILDADFDTNEEIEDSNYQPNEQELQNDLNNSLEESSQENIPNEEGEVPSIDVDQVPVGKVEFELTERKVCKGEALVFAGSDEKITTINELECGDTIDEEDCTFNEAEAEAEEGDDSQEMGDDDDKNADKSDQDDDEDINEEDDEDLKNIEVVTKPGTDICKLKFKDVEAWKNSNMEESSQEENEENEGNEKEEEEEAEADAEAEPEPEQNLSKICENYNENEDEDYNPIYNEDTLSDIECEEDQDREDDEDLKKPEVIQDDEFCMIKQDEVPVIKNMQDSREEMECC